MTKLSKLEPKDFFKFGTVSFKLISKNEDGWYHCKIRSQPCYLKISENALVKKLDA